jgi:hypothetical protein
MIQIYSKIMSFFLERKYFYSRTHEIAVEYFERIFLLRHT